MIGNIVRQVGVKNCETCPVSYRFINHQDKVYHTALLGYSYDSEQISIDPTGKITVFAGAGSDGCTPVWLFANRIFGGVPNGPLIRTESGKLEPVTARAFYLHDWLLNTRSETFIPVDLIHKEFCIEIRKTDFWARNIYCKMVKWFGPKD